MVYFFPLLGHWEMPKLLGVHSRAPSVVVAVYVVKVEVVVVVIQYSRNLPSLSNSFLPDSINSVSFSLSSELK